MNPIVSKRWWYRSMVAIWMIGFVCAASVNIERYWVQCLIYAMGIVINILLLLRVDSLHEKRATLWQMIFNNAGKWDSSPEYIKRMFHDPRLR